MINTENIILATDSYKLNHWNQYPKNTEAVYSYFEAREGAEFPYTVFFGLQYLLKKYFEGVAVTQADVDEAAELAEAHFGNPDYFNLAGWQHIVDHHGGRLPLRIKAVPEGLKIPNSNVLLTIENTDPKCYWLTNHVESILTHVWYSSVVATLSARVKYDLQTYLNTTADGVNGINFMLHDFGYRGATTHEAAGIGGAGHLVNFQGTDTLPAMQVARKYYDADLSSLAFSVSATEHSVMTALGRDGEYQVVDQLFEEYPTGILSVVADSYDIYQFVENIGTLYKDRVLQRDGVFVVRPDSVTKVHNSPDLLVQWILENLWANFGGEVNSKGYKVLDPHVRVLWGDGIGPRGIRDILSRTTLAGFSVENLVFGMGGGLLQKVNRDTQRFAFKSSAQKRDGQWHDVYKEPLDSSKKSKRGRLSLAKAGGKYRTVLEGTAVPFAAGNEADVLQVVFENGELKNQTTFDEVRSRAA